MVAGRARAEAPDRQLRVLREVLPVARDPARHPGQCFGQLRPGPGAAGVDPDRVQAGRQGERGDAGYAGGLHLHGGQGGGGRLGHAGKWRQQQGGQRQAMASCGGIQDSG
ncbi:hypothetical protein G6F40_014804 [Rhizopus arrhizus]|nr:hypothetical protein G6F40_014804 [Rhizopus arrhizus]